MWLVIPFDHCLIATTWLLCSTTANELEYRLGEFIKDISQPESRWDEKSHGRKIEEVTNTLQQYIPFRENIENWYESCIESICQAARCRTFTPKIDIPISAESSQAWRLATGTEQEVHLAPPEIGSVTSNLPVEIQEPAYASTISGSEDGEFDADVQYDGQTYRLGGQRCSN
jgi:hypothetical protein